MFLCSTSSAELLVKSVGGLVCSCAVLVLQSC